MNPTLPTFHTNDRITLTYTYIYIYIYIYIYKTKYRFPVGQKLLNKITVPRLFIDFSIGQSLFRKKIFTDW